MSVYFSSNCRLVILVSPYAVWVESGTEFWVHFRSNPCTGFYPTAFKGCQGIVFTHGVWIGGRAGRRAAGNRLSGLYLRNRKV